MTWLAWSVHLYTASGALAGLLGLQRLLDKDPYGALMWMFVAVIIDSTDGFFARLLRVRDRVPEIDGRRLDDMVDYFTWVVLPVAFMARMGVLPPVPLIWGLPLLASGLGMANQSAKTEDNFFLGFPSLWNVVALYLWLFGLPTDINAGIVAVLSLMVLIPTRYVYPSKTPQYIVLTNVLMGLWLTQLMAWFTWPQYFDSPLFRWSSLLFPTYYMALSFYLDRKLPRNQGSTPPEGV